MAVVVRDFESRRTGHLDDADDVREGTPMDIRTDTRRRRIAVDRRHRPRILAGLAKPTRYAEDRHRSEHSARRFRRSRPVARRVAERRCAGAHVRICSSRPASHWNRSSRMPRRSGRRTRPQADRRATQNPAASRTRGAKGSESPADSARTAARPKPRGGATGTAADPDAAERETGRGRAAGRTAGVEVHTARSHRHQRACPQRREVRRHRPAGGVPAQWPEVRRHEHLPSHPAGVERGAVQRRQRGGTRYVRPVRDGGIQDAWREFLHAHAGSASRSKCSKTCSP